MKHTIFVFVFASLLVLSVWPAEAKTRTYYIAADDVIWNYAPSGKDLIDGKPLPPLMRLQLGWSFRKSLYHEYTDASFTHLKPRPASEAYLGLIGPIIHAEVGDTIVVVFKNNSKVPLSVHPHGVFYKKNSEGAPYVDGVSAGDKPGSSVAPGHTFTYTWDVPERSGPGPADDSSVMWMFHSHTDEVRDVNTGPIGIIVVTRRGMANPDGTPKDVDREIFAMFAEDDESSSRYFASNEADRHLNPRKVTAKGPQLFMDEFYGVNGFVYGNMPLVSMHVGQRVRWYVMSTMSDFDFHTPHWHGNTVLVSGMRTDVVQIFPMQMIVADMVPDNPGIWLIHCHVNLHLQMGMEARFQVLK